MTGFVSLVGAGPGDPELLTRRAVDRLARADLVLYDALVDRAVLRLAGRARWFYVGKRARRRSIDQDTIQRLMIRAARRGERVVRLKCGDPFVLGRGGEEALALAAAGVPFEVVPGISAAVAAPALCGIPVTHRGLASAFLVVSGHAESGYRAALESLAPGSATVVVLMGMAHRAAIARLLLARGWAPSTPAALALHASWPDAALWTGALAELAAGPPRDAASDAPGVIVVGAVISVATALEGLGVGALGGDAHRAAAPTGASGAESPRSACP